MKNIFKEILIITGFAVLFGLFYNSQIDKGISVIPEEKEEVIAPDEELFGSGKKENKDEIKDTSQSQPEKDIAENKSPKTVKDRETGQEQDTEADKSKKAFSNQDTVQEKDVQKDTAEKKELQTLENQEKQDGIKSVTYNQMIKIIGNDEFIIIDARSDKSYEDNRIGDAIHINPYWEPEEKVVEAIYELPYDKKIVIYCDGGNCDSSIRLAEMIKAFGYEKIYHYPEGWEEWQEKKSES